MPLLSHFNFKLLIYNKKYFYFMKNISSFSDFLNENIGETHQQRFDRAIYLTYVQLHKDNQFKKVSKEDFYKQLYSILDRIETVKYDMKDIYRLADSKYIWLSKSGRTLGEVYKEFDEDTKEDVISYWINKEKY
jgi:heme oxygenase